MPDEPSNYAFPRFLSLLRRRWWLLPIAFLGLALLGSAISPGRINAQADISIHDAGPSLLASQVLELRLSIPFRTKTEFVQFLNGSTLNSRLNEEIPGTSVNVIDSAVPRGFRLSVVGPSTAKTAAALDWVIHESQAYRVAEAEDLYGRVKSILDDRQNVLGAREVELTKELMEPAPAGVVSSLGAERRQIREGLDSLASGRAIIKGLSDDPTGGLEVIRRIDPTALGSRISLKTSKSVALGTLGALLAVAVLSGFAAMDKRIRFRSDIEQIAGAGAVTAIIDSDESNIASLALSGRYAALQSGIASMLLVPIGSEGGRAAATAARLAGATTTALAEAQMGTAPGFVVRAVEAYPASSAGLAVAATGFGAVYLVADAGLTHKDDLSVAIRAFSNAGISLAGIVLAGVRPGDLRSVSR